MICTFLVNKSTVSIFGDILFTQVVVVNLFNFCVFYAIFIRFGLGANIGLKKTLKEFEMTMAIFLTDWTNQSKPTYSKSF